MYTLAGLGVLLALVSWRWFVASRKLKEADFLDKERRTSTLRHLMNVTEGILRERLPNLAYNSSSNLPVSSEEIFPNPLCWECTTDIGDSDRLRLVELIRLEINRGVVSGIDTVQVGSRSGIAPASFQVWEIDRVRDHIAACLKEFAAKGE